MVTSVLDQIIARWLQPPMSYIILAIVVALIVYFFFRKFYTPVIKRFKGEGIDQIVKELNITPQFRKFSRVCKRGKLIHNLGTVEIGRVMNATVKGSDKKETNFILFETKESLVSKIPIFNKIQGGLEYFVINNDSTHIEKDKYRDIWVVKPNVYMHTFAGVWICSEQGTNFLTDLIYKRTYENAREEEMNYIKRVVWYNDLYASKMTRDHVEHDLEQEGYDSRIERETGVRKR